MAIKIDVKLENGLECKGAYCRVESLSVTKQNINFSLRKYVREDLPAFDGQSYFCDYVLDGENPYKQAYNYLKTLPEFADAIDC